MKAKIAEKQDFITNGLRQLVTFEEQLLLQIQLENKIDVLKLEKTELEAHIRQMEIRIERLEGAFTCRGGKGCGQ